MKRSDVTPSAFRQERFATWAEAQARAASLRIQDGRLKVYVVEVDGGGAVVNIEPKRRGVSGRYQ